jgi:rod shape-determining protein MreC
VARPSNRRPGYSRRAQYGLFFGYVTAVSGVIIAVLLLILSAVDPRAFGALKGAVTDATLPISAGGRAVVRTIRDVGSDVGAYVDAATKVRRIEAEAKRNETRLIQARAVAVENARLKRLLGIVERGVRPIAVARLVSSSGTSVRRFAVLSAGVANGVRGGMPVRAPDGLVGRVTSAGALTARVALISDGGTVVPVMRARDGLPAIATGLGDGTLDIRTLGAETNPFRPGEVLVTSGAGGVYPPNIPVARVRRVTRDAAIALPLADPARLDYAIVERPFQPAVEQAQQALPPAAGE